jgi:hypothetical protein
MFEIARNFEQVAARFNAIVLIGVGLADVLLGLFVWLGGLDFRKLLVAVIGAVSGGLCGFFIVGQNVASAVILAGLAAFVAIVFEKTFITILAALLAAVFCFAVLAGPYIEGVDNFNTSIKQACLQMPVSNWAIIAASAAIFIVTGIFLWRLTSALCCAALGTIFIFAGMILLLLYKGAEPISYIGRRTSLYTAVFVAMIVLGTIEQLLLCGYHRRRPVKKTNKTELEPDKTAPNWRTQ